LGQHRREEDEARRPRQKKISSEKEDRANGDTRKRRKESEGAGKFGEVKKYSEHRKGQKRIKKKLFET